VADPNITIGLLRDMITQHRSIDFGRFFEQVTVFIFCQRLQVVWDIATSENFSRQVFNAYSATSRLNLIARILSMREIEDAEEPSDGGPFSLVGH